MQPVQMSSGDLVADRRASYAEMLLEAGEASAAADLMRDALELVPGWTAGWFRLGEMMEVAGRTAEAADAWREVLRLDPLDRLGAALKLELVGMVEGLDAPPIAFVETLFDQYADSFDAALVGQLDYRVPQLLSAALAATGRARFAHAVDLGCGTGLLAEHLRSRVSFMEGVDISAQMLKRAEGKGLYDRLSHADLNRFVFPAGVDLVAAADVFMYVGDITDIVRRVAAALPVGALFAFSVERGADDIPFLLRHSRRYAHSGPALRALLADCGLDILSMETAVIRMDAGEPLEGLIVVAERQACTVALPVGAETEPMPLTLH